MTLRDEILKIIDDVVDEYCDPQKATDQILALVYKDLDDEMNLGRCPTCGRRVED